MGRVLLYYPEMESLAKKIVAHSNLIRLGRITWDYFEDGYPNIFIHEVRDLRGSDVSFLVSFASPARIFEQMAVIRALPRYGVRSLRIFLPYFPTGTMERVDVEGQIATAKSLARDLSHVPSARNGPPELIVYDIHVLGERFYFEDSVLPRLETALPLLTDCLRKLNNVSVAFPDEGAAKRFGEALKGFPQIICTKIRAGDKRIVTIKEGDPSGRHVVIVDDLVKTGRTLLACKDVIINRGASAVSAYATHGVFPQDSWKIFLDAGFTNFWITDSCPIVNSLYGIGPFKVLSLAPLIYNLIVSP